MTQAVMFISQTLILDQRAVLEMDLPTNRLSPYTDMVTTSPSFVMSIGPGRQARRTARDWTASRLFHLHRGERITSPSTSPPPSHRDASIWQCRKPIREISLHGLFATFCRVQSVVESTGRLLTAIHGSSRGMKLAITAPTPPRCRQTLRLATRSRPTLS